MNVNGLRRVWASAIVIGMFVVLPAPSARASLIAYWPFDGCTTTDASGHAYHLSGNGSPTCVAGRFGTAWQLNGQDQWLDVANGAPFTPGSQPWTVALWVRSQDTVRPSSLLTWYRCGANPLCSGPDAAAYFLSMRDGRGNWWIRDDLATTLECTDTLETIADGNWHFLAATFSAATDSSKLYVDARLVATATGALGTLFASGTPLDIGRTFRTGWGVPGEYLNGAVDEVRIYDEELPAAQIAGLFVANSTVDVGDGSSLPSRVTLRAWPNPARGGRVTVSFRLASDEPAELALYDVAGRLVLRERPATHRAGDHDVVLGSERPLRAGVYRLRLTQGAHASSRPLIVLD